MAKKGSGPTLYDVIKTGHPPPSVAPRDDSIGAGSDTGRQGGSTTPSSSSLLRPGRMITFPVGYVLVAAAVVIMFIVAGYIVGYKRAVNVTVAQFEQERVDELNAAEQLDRTSDPLATDSPRFGGGAAAAGRDGDRPGGGTPSQSRPGNSSSETGDPTSEGFRPPEQWGPIDRPQRQPGLNYFALMTTELEGAMRLAEFCRQEGLEAYVVVGNNTARTQVIVFPGFRGGPESQQIRDTLRSRIGEVGRKWKETQGGSSDLSDAIPYRYRG